MLLFILFTDGNDYNSFTNLLLTFDSVTTTIDIPVTIIDDTAFELRESFNASLSFPGAPVPRVTLSPDSAQTTIFDEDGWCSLLQCPYAHYTFVYPLVLTFGFEPTVYSVNEGDGPVDLGIFISGDAGEFVPHVTTSTVDGTVTGGYCMCHLTIAST